jgi:hypothetical protein
VLSTDEMTGIQALERKHPTSTAWRKKESLLHTALLGYPASRHSDHAA